MAAPFEIRLLSANVSRPEPERDPMLGGHLRVTVNGVVIADDGDFGLERSALGLLRTVEEDHDATSPDGELRNPARRLSGRSCAIRRGGAYFADGDKLTKVRSGKPAGG